MRMLALVLVLLPAWVLAQEQPAPPAPQKPPAKDQVYKWVDKDGVVHYSSQPPAEGAQPAKLPPLQTYKGGTNPNLKKFEKPGGAAAPAAAASQIEIVTPSHDETFRSGERVVPVAVMVTPQLGEGQKLIYLLDGEPASAPTSNTSFAITGVERGVHTVSVSLVDAATGETLASSSGVTIHMKPPIAGQAERIRDSQKPKTPTTPPSTPKPKPPSP
jgi:hypothetical protein